MRTGKKRSDRRRASEIALDAAAPQPFESVAPISMKRAPNISAALAGFGKAGTWCRDGKAPTRQAGPDAA